MNKTLYIVQILTRKEWETVNVFDSYAPAKDFVEQELLVHPTLEIRTVVATKCEVLDPKATEKHTECCHCGERVKYGNKLYFRYSWDWPEEPQVKYYCSKECAEADAIFQVFEGTPDAGKIYTKTPEWKEEEVEYGD